MRGFDLLINRERNSSEERSLEVPFGQKMHIHCKLFNTSVLVCIFCAVIHSSFPLGSLFYGSENTNSEFCC